MEEKFEKIVKFSPPFDKRHSDPKKNYGIGAMRIWFILKGKKGAAQVLLSTNCYLSSTVNEYSKDERNLFKDFRGNDADTITCWDVGFHYKKRPNYMTKSDKRECNLFKGGCYYDGSACRGDTDKVAEMFLEKGEDAIWRYLEKNYKKEFGE